MRLAVASCSATLSASLPRRRAFSALTSPFREGDVVLLKRTDRPDAAPILTRPLQYDGLIESHRGAIHHRDIIGKSPSQIVKSSIGRAHHLHHPTLAEYVRLTPRLVTPVYPGEANLIVSLLDIHASAPDARDVEDGAGPVEILEAGTGHGSLTLHLARAIHAANVVDAQGPSDAGNDFPQAPMPRRATVHTLDISLPNSKHAMNIVRNFRRGLYSTDVEFHTGTASDFVAAQMEQRESSSPFLSYAVLDLPGVAEHVEHVSPALHPQGLLAAFCPSVTQLVDIIRLTKNKRLPLFLDRVVELGASMGAGRPWDLRLVSPKRQRSSEGVLEKSDPASADDSEPSENLQSASLLAGPGHRSEGSGSDDQIPRENLPDIKISAENDVDSWNVICRPKYGDMSTAGGFLGIWRKIRHD